MVMKVFLQNEVAQFCIYENFADHLFPIISSFFIVLKIRIYYPTSMIVLLFHQSSGVQADAIQISKKYISPRVMGTTGTNPNKVCREVWQQIFSSLALHNPTWQTRLTAPCLPTYTDDLVSWFSITSQLWAVRFIRFHPTGSRMAAKNSSDQSFPCSSFAVA